MNDPLDEARPSLGAGVMIMPPYYGETPAAVDDALRGADACRPIMIYNAPYASHIILMPEHIQAAVERQRQMVS